MLRAFIGGLLLAALAQPAEDAYQSAARKFALIEEDRAAPGARIWISVKELNAYAAVKLCKWFPRACEALAWYWARVRRSLSPVWTF